MYDKLNPFWLDKANVKRQEVLAVTWVKKHNIFHLFQISGHYLGGASYQNHTKRALSDTNKRYCYSCVSYHDKEKLQTAH